MTAGVLAMLLGLFAVPTFLLWAGHHFRKRSAAMRGAFWGGVIGHSVAALVATVAGLYAPVVWSDSDILRGFAGFWGMLVIGVAGIAIGAFVGSRE